MEKLEACFQLVGCKNVTTSVYTVWEFFKKFNAELACAQRVYFEVYILRNRKQKQEIVGIWMRNVLQKLMCFPIWSPVGVIA